MAFAKEAVRTPISIGDISVDIFSPAPGSDEPAGATYSVQVNFSDGSKRVLTGNLLPQLTAGQITTLTQFMATIRTKTTAEILP